MEKRIKEICDSIHSFSKALYSKKEIFPELLSLQEEMVNLTFNGLHAENGSLRLYDVGRYFRGLNQECGGIATEELARFERGSKDLCNLIRSESSGLKGEKRAFLCLETLRCKNRVVKNVELKSGDHRTELDAVVLTEKAVFLIEVKNAQKDVYISENGNYYRIVKGKRELTKHLGEKMNEKEYLLRQALRQAGIENANVINLVVMTNSGIEVENRYPHFEICYLSNLPYKIREVQGGVLYSDALMDRMTEAIESCRCQEEYSVEFDVQAFKYDFACLMAKLEAAKDESTKATERKEEITEEKEETAMEKRPVSKGKNKKALGGIAASLAFATIAAGVALAFLAKKKAG